METLWGFAGRRGECVRSRGELRLKRNVGRRPAQGGRGRGALNRGRGEERGLFRAVQHVGALLLQWMASEGGREKDVRRQEINALSEI